MIISHNIYAIHVVSIAMVTKLQICHTPLDSAACRYGCVGLKTVTVTFLDRPIHDNPSDNVIPYKVDSPSQYYSVCSIQLYKLYAIICRPVISLKHPIIQLYRHQNKAYTAVGSKHTHNHQYMHYVHTWSTWDMKPNTPALPSYR